MVPTVEMFSGCYPIPFSRVIDLVTLVAVIFLLLGHNGKGDTSVPVPNWVPPSTELEDTWDDDST